jgi:hypothetical protein
MRRSPRSGGRGRAAPPVRSPQVNASQASAHDRRRARRASREAFTRRA